MFKQFFAITALGLQTLPQRLGSSSVIVIGIAGVVGVLISVMAMSIGFRHTLADAGRSDRAIILRGGSDAELNSNLTRADVDTISNAPGILKDARGQPALSRELVSVANIPRIDTGTDSNVSLRGVGGNMRAVRPELTIVQGRMFKPAVRELIAGAGAAQQFRGLTPGGIVHMRNADWTVTGVFTSNGDAHESELMADGDTLGSTLERTGYSSAIVLLTGPDQFTAFKDALTTDPQLKVDVQREKDYFAKQSTSLSSVLRVVGNSVAVIMAIGAMFGALNSLYSAVAARGMEIATLRAIGFASVPVLLSVLVESLTLSLLGGVIGAAFAWFVFNGHQVSTLGAAFSQVVFHLVVTPGLIITGIVWACVIGLLGGVFPALRAARLPVAEALRAHG